MKWRLGPAPSSTSDGSGLAPEPDREEAPKTDGEKLMVKGGAAVAALLFLLWFAIAQTNQQKYFVPLVFAVLLVAQSDPGGAIGRRVEGMSASFCLVPW